MKTGIKMIALAMIFNGTDILSGLLVAIKQRIVVSSKLRNGMFKKTGFMLCYFMAWLLDNFGDTVGFSVGVKILPLITLYAIITEVVSVIENVSELNPQLLPSKLLEIFQISVRNEEHEENGKDGEVGIKNGIE